MDRVLERIAGLGFPLPSSLGKRVVHFFCSRLPLPSILLRLLIRLLSQPGPMADFRHRAVVVLDRLMEDDNRSWHGTRDFLFPDGRLLTVESLIIQKGLARTFRRLVEVEKANAYRGREEAILAARNFFYEGPIAQEIVRFCEQRGGLLTMEDLARFQVTIEPPAKSIFKGIEICIGGPWCQGPVLNEALNILEGFDLKGMGHNTVEYVHCLIETLKLAFADREAYLGDPEFVDVPLVGLLAKSYAAERRNCVDPREAKTQMPEPGDPWPYQGDLSYDRAMAYPKPIHAKLEADTSYLCVVDRWGNAFSATPSDGITNSPIIPGLGFVISPRGSQTWLDPMHPSALAPGKRPRLTPSPGMALIEGKVWMTFGTPGGDIQCQAMAQLLLNVIVFGMDLHQAIDAPRVSTLSFPNSFWPHSYHPGLVKVESRLDSGTIAELTSLGHNVEVAQDWTALVGSLCAIKVDRQDNVMTAGVDPRLKSGSAMGR